MRCQLLNLTVSFFDDRFMTSVTVIHDKRGVLGSKFEVGAALIWVLLGTTFIAADT